MSKLLSFCCHSNGQGPSSSWTSCTDLLYFCKLWHCHCLCIGLYTALRCLATATHLAICWALSLRMPYTTILTVLNHLILSLPSIVTCLPILSNRVIFLVFFYVVQHLFFSLSVPPFSGHIFIFGHWWPH